MIENEPGNFKEKITEERESVVLEDIKKLEQIASNGNSEAAFYIALFYCEGNKKIQSNNEIMFKWIAFAAEKGEPAAMFCCTQSTMENIV